MVIVLFSASLVFTSCVRNGSDSGVTDVADELSDSAKLIDLHNDVLDMVGSIYSNQGRSVNADVVSLSDTDGSPADFGSFARKGTVYVYFTPLACWECLRVICRAALECDNDDSLCFVVPASLRDAVGRIMSECEIPSDRIYYLNGSLGLPVEMENKVFFFTISRHDDNPRRLYIDNVFAPIRDADVVATYMYALADIRSSESAL